jgi:hypothetical protein
MALTLSIFRTLDADETEEDVKTTSGDIYGIIVGNKAASINYLKLYNATAANTTVGTTTPAMTITLPATSNQYIPFSHPVNFSTAICVAAVTGVADSDTTGASANDVTVTIFYK